MSNRELIVSYNELMAKGDFASITVDNFGKGINLVDPVQELESGYLGPETLNVLPVGKGKSLKPTDSVFTALALATSATRRPVELTRYSGGLLVANKDGSVDRVSQTGTITSFAATDAAGIPEVVVSQDAALTTYYAYILRPSGSAATSVKVNLSTAASVTWPGTPPLGACAISWKTRMVIGQGSRVRFSTEGDPDTWPANNFIDIKTLDDALDDIVAFEIMGEDLLVYKKKSLWLIFDPVSFDNRRLFSVGAVNRRCVSRGTDRVFWLAPSGVFSTDGSELFQETKKIDTVFQTGQFGGNAFDAIFNIWTSGGLYPYCSLIATPNDTIVVSDGTNRLLVGYVQYRDINGDIPWFPLRGHMPTVAGLVYAQNDFTGAAGDKSLGIVGATWDQTGANSNNLMRLIDSGVPGGVEIAGGDFNSIEPIIELPFLHNDAVEGYSRMRRLNLYGEGTLADTATATIEVYKDNDVLASSSKIAQSFTDDVIRVKPEVRGRSFRVHIKGFGQFSNFILHSAEFQFRRAGR